MSPWDALGSSSFHGHFFFLWCFHFFPELSPAEPKLLSQPVSAENLSNTQPECEPGRWVLVLTYAWRSVTSLKREGGLGGGETGPDPALTFIWHRLFLLLRYADKLFLPKFLLLASGCLRGFLLLGCCSAGLLAERFWTPSAVPAQGNWGCLRISPVCFVDVGTEAQRGCASAQPHRDWGQPACCHTDHIAVALSSQKRPQR